jgi:lipoyl(octanoyl) transferase
LQVYLLGSVAFEAALAFQGRLTHEVVNNRGSAALIFCEHPPGITVGRQGSWAHIRCDTEGLRERRWRVRWVNRGGGCLLHAPGQLAIYPILPLDRFGLGLRAYLEQLQQVLIQLLDDFGVCGETRTDLPGVWVGARPVAGVGVAVRDWVSYYGAALNVGPDLEPFRLVRWGGADAEAMTSLERERRGPLRPALVRERLLEHFAGRFGFSDTALFFGHPSLRREAPSDAIVTSS